MSRYRDIQVGDRLTQKEKTTWLTDFLNFHLLNDTSIKANSFKTTNWLVPSEWKQTNESVRSFLPTAHFQKMFQEFPWELHQRVRCSRKMQDSDFLGVVNESFKDNHRHRIFTFEKIQHIEIWCSFDFVWFPFQISRISPYESRWNRRGLFSLIRGPFAGIFNGAMILRLKSSPKHVEWL